MHFCTICEIILLVDGPWKTNGVLEKSLAVGDLGTRLGSVVLKIPDFPSPIHSYGNSEVTRLAQTYGPGMNYCVVHFTSH